MHETARLCAGPPVPKAQKHLYDLFSSEKPAYWSQRANDYYRVLLINRNDEPGSYAFDLKPYGITADAATDFWNGQPAPVNDGVIRAELQPRSCLPAVVK